MKVISALVILAFSGSMGAYSQGRPVDWPFYGGDAQRTGWEKSDSRITKANVKDFVLVLKRKLDNKGKGPRSLTPPVVIGNLISYRGFKELAFVAGSSDTIWSIDADMDRVFWQKQLETGGTPTKVGGASAFCSGSVVATPSLTPPTNFGGGRGAQTAASSAAPVVKTGRNLLNAGGGSGGFGSPRPAFALSNNGVLHLLNTSNGADLATAPFVPPNAKASSLTISEGVVYTTTSGGCGGTPDGIWALDLADANTVAKFHVGDSSISSLGGLAIGASGTVYVQTGAGTLDPSANKWGNTLLALNAKDLKMQHYFTAQGTGVVKKDAAHINVSAPVVFTYKQREIVASAGNDGRLSLLDGKNLGGDDHKTALYQTPPLAAAGGGIWGGLSSWEDPDGMRWILAPVWGALNADLHAPLTNGNAQNGSIVAFKLEEKEGKLILTPAWVSRDMNSPEPPVITSGMIFALAAGEYSRDEKPKGSSHAILYALDGLTGKEVYSTGSQVTSPANLTGMTIANSRVYFTTADNTLYAFGILLER